MRDKIFISYSHQDIKFRERLEIHLKPLTDKASYWSDNRLEAGDDWEKKIHSAMNETAVAILLISADFMASSFIRNVELPTLRKAKEVDDIYIIPVIVHYCFFDDWLKYQCPNKNEPERPLGKLKKHTREEVYARLAKDAVNKLEVYSKRKPSEVPIPQCHFRVEDKTLLKVYFDESSGLTEGDELLVLKFLDLHHRRQGKPGLKIVDDIRHIFVEKEEPKL